MQPRIRIYSSGRHPESPLPDATTPPWPSPTAVRRIMAIAALLVTAATFIPYLVQASHPPDGRTFTWMFLRLPDEASYLMWMDQHAAGRLWAENRMALGVDGAIPPNPVWLVLGRIQAWTGLPGIAIYHAGRAALALVYLAVLGALCLRALPSPRQALAAFLVAATGSGLGWLESTGLPVRSADWITELWGFPSIFHYPHFAAALALAAGGLLLLWRARDSQAAEQASSSRAMADAAGAGLAWGLLVFVHPYTAGTLYVALGLSLLLEWPATWGRRPEATPWRDRLRAVSPALIVLGIGMIAVLLMAFQVAGSPAMRTWAAQNRLPSPPPAAYLLGVGLVGVGAAWGIARRLQARDWPPMWRLLAAWIVAAAGLAYAGPLIPFERRCVEGVHVALVLFAVAAIGPWLDRIGRRATALVLAGLVLAVAPTNVLMLAREAANPAASAQVRDDWPDLFRTVRSLPHPRTVCTDGRTGMFLAAFAGATVNAGHDQLTPDLPARLAEFDTFVQTPAPWPQRASWMQDAGCRWLVLTPKTVAGLPPDDFPESRVAARGRTWVLLGPADSTATQPQQPESPPGS